MNPTSVPQNDSSSRLRRVLVALLLVAATVLLLLRGFDGVWLWDDYGYILNRPQVMALWPPHYLFASSRPVAYLTFAVNHALGGFDIFGYHLFNLVVHLASALLLMDLLRRCLAGRTSVASENEKTDAAAFSSSVESPATEESGSSRSRFALLAAFAVALLWAIHPVQTFGVFYIWQRCESLMAFFFLLTLFCLQRRAEGGGLGWSAAAVGACLLGMGTKEAMAVAPLTALLFDRALYAGSFRACWRERGGLHLALWATILLVPLLLRQNDPTFHNPGVGFGPRAMSPVLHALNMPPVLLGYLKLILWPRPLAVSHHWEPTEAWSVLLPSGIVLAALLLLTARGLWRNRPWALPAASVFVLLAPTSSIMPTPDLFVPYRLYLPLAPLLVLAGLGLWRLLGARALYAALAGVLLWGSLTPGQTTIFASRIRFWEAAIEANPAGQRAWRMLGHVLLESGRVRESIPVLEHAFRLDSRSKITPLHLGKAYLQAGDLVRAAHWYALCLERLPDQDEAHNGLGVALVGLGRHEEALAAFEAALRLRPGDRHYRENLDRLRAMMQTPAPPALAPASPPATDRSAP